MKSVKSCIYSVITASLLSLSISHAQVTTGAVGFIKIPIPAPTAGQSTVTPLGFPLFKNAVDVGLVSSVGANTLSNAGAAWVVDAFSGASAPHFVKIVSGPASGRFFQINSNTSTVLTVDNGGVSLTGFVTPDANGQIKYQILPGYTLSALFSATPSFSVFSNANPNLADLVRIYRVVPPATTPSWVSFWHNGAEWRRIGSALGQNDTLIYPDEGLLFVRRGTSASSFTVVGAASTSTEQSQIPGPDVTPLANRFPVDLTLGTLGLDSMPGWRKDVNPNVADLVRIYDGTQWLSYWYSPGNPPTVPAGWKRIGASGDQAATPVPAGSSILIVRRSTSDGVTDFLSQNPTY